MKWCCWGLWSSVFWTIFQGTTAPLCRRRSLNSQSLWSTPWGEGSTSMTTQVRLPFQCNTQVKSQNTQVTTQYTLCPSHACHYTHQGGILMINFYLNTNNGHDYCILILFVSLVTLGGLKDHIKEIQRCRRLILIACGTSYHAGVAVSTRFPLIRQQY